LEALDVILNPLPGSGRVPGSEALTRRAAVEYYGFLLDMPGGLAFQTLEKVGLSATVYLVASAMYRFNIFARLAKLR
jgi:hypothetical protein